MKTLTITTEIPADGKLRLEVPCDLPPGPAEVTLTVRACARSGMSARSGLFIGKARPDVDIEATLKEMNDMWESKILAK